MSINDHGGIWYINAFYPLLSLRDILCLTSLALNGHGYAFSPLLGVALQGEEDYLSCGEKRIS